MEQEHFATYGELERRMAAARQLRAQTIARALASSLRLAQRLEAAALDFLTATLARLDVLRRPSLR